MSAQIFASVQKLLAAIITPKEIIGIYNREQLINTSANVPADLPNGV